MATETAKQKLEKSMVGFRKIIADPNTQPSMKTAMEKALKNAEAKLKAMPDEEGDKKEGSKPESKPAATKEKKATAKKSDGEGTTKKKDKKPGAAKKETPKKEEEEEFVTITVTNKDGKRVKETFNINNCEEAIAAAHARKQRDTESGKKTKSKSAGKKAADRIGLAVEGITELIPQKMIDQDPKLVIEALEKFENKQAAAVVELCKSIGVPKALIEKLEAAYANAIDPVIEEIKAYIAKSKEQK